MDARDLNRERALAQLGAPPSSGAKKKVAKPTAGSEQPRNPSILVVEDDPSATELATAVLSSRGYTVYATATVKGAIENLHSHSDIALVLCDVRLQHEDGFEVANFLNKNLRFSDIPFIMCSSCALREVVSRALELGAADYIAKPYTSETLLAKVEAQLQSKSWSSLLVSQDKVSLEILGRILRRDRCDIFVAQSGKEALSILLKCRVDVVVTDLGLSDCTGPELMMEIKESNMNIPVFLIGDFSSRVKEEDVVAAGANGLIMRPFYGFEIVRKLRTAMKENKRKRNGS